MELKKIKLLSNYQLFQLAQNELLDQETLTKARQEIAFRNISTIEIKELKEQHDASLDQFRKELVANYWDPFYTAFAWRRHFRYIALLRAQGSKSEAKTYRMRFYFGIVVYMLVFVCTLLLFRK